MDFTQSRKHRTQITKKRLGESLRESKTKHKNRLLKNVNLFIYCNL